MIHHGTRIPLVGAGEATIFIFGDRQQGSSGYKEEAWQEFRREFKATKNAWAIGVGDYGDWLRPSMRTPVINALSKDDSARSMLDGDIRRGHDKIIDDMAFLEGRLVGLHEGHHNWKFASGETTDQRLASALKAPYLGWIATTRLVFTYGNDDRKKGGHSLIHTLISTHGNANGRKVHSALAYLENNYAGSWICDSYAMGHGCKSGNHVPFKRNHVRRAGPFGIDVQIPRCLVVGGFAEGYTDGWQSDYVERAGFAPQPLGYGLFRFKRVVRRNNQIIRGVVNPRTCSLQVEPVNRVLEM
jgi:hypothetical protein